MKQRLYYHVTFQGKLRLKLLNMKGLGKLILDDTGKSLSEAFIFASINPQYDERLFIELQVQYMKIPRSNLGRTCCVQKLFLTFRTIFVHNMQKEELLTKIYLYKLHVKTGAIIDFGLRSFKLIATILKALVFYWLNIHKKIYIVLFQAYP